MIWLKRVGFVFGTLAWSAAVFAATWSLTFPDDAFAEYVAWKIQEGSKSEKALTADALHPYLPWLGLRGVGITGENVVLYNRDRPRRGEPGLVHPILHADAMSVHANWLNVPRMILGGTGSFSGTATLSGGDLGFAASIGKKDDKATLTSLSVDSTGFPISAVPLGVGSLQGTGGVDIHVDLDAPDGFSKANGTIAITGASINIDKLLLDALDGADPGVKIALSEADLSLDVVSGKAKVTTGHIVTDIATIDVEGDVVLQDDPMNSRLRLKFLITLADGPMSTLLGGLLGKDAKWEDGKYHYALSGNLKSAHPRPERERRARAGGPNRLRASKGEDGELIEPPLGLPPGMGPGLPPGAGVGPMNDIPMPNDDPAQREERQRRREELAAERRERLRLRREEQGFGPNPDNDIVQPPPPDDEPPPPPPDDFPQPEDENLPP